MSTLSTVSSVSTVSTVSTVVDDPTARRSSPRWGARVRAVLLVAALVALGARVGTSEALDALARLSAGTVLLALGLGAVATAASALRWRAVAAALGVELPAAAAWAAVYRATLLNSLLPGGFVGDLDRAIDAHQHARRQRADPRQAARVVVLERSAGQGVVFVAALVVVIIGIASGAVPGIGDAMATSVGQTHARVAAIAAPTAGLVLLVAGYARARRTTRTTNRKPEASPGPGFIASRELARGQLAALGTELRATVLRPRTAVVVLASSLIGFAALLGTFVLAADVVGVAAAAWQLVPLCTVGLLAMAVPINVGGWGPRELTLAAAFAAAGFGAPTGLAVSVLYGVLTLLGVLPAALLLALDVVRRGRGRDCWPEPPVEREAAGQPQSRPSSSASSRAR